MGLAQFTYKSTFLDKTKLDSFRGEEMNGMITQGSELSIIATARNDNHGGNLLHRMQIFANGLLAQSAKYRLRTELVLIEWNPPSDKPKLTQALSWPKRHNFCTVRIIEVPPKIHRRYKHSDNLPLYQMIAKNVGIRRARGEFILATNIDILFSDELFAFFASGKITKGKMYRVDRYDVQGDIPLESSIDEQLSYCYQNVIRISSRDGTRNLITDDYHMVYPPNGGVERACLHTNACGDFTLLAKEHWHELCGYPEFDMFSFHLDSLLCFMAHHGGASEEILGDPMRIYHIEHKSGWTPEVHKDKTLDNRLKRANIPTLSNAEFDNFAVKMTKEKQPIIFNNENWGLANEALPETIVCGGGNSK
ncbi:hypothetical protein KJ654_04710 [Patescibacteria group bacterium]|nr:hypothetical protein [Patescibacteria group bacterium]